MGGDEGSRRQNTILGNGKNLNDTALHLFYCDRDVPENGREVNHRQYRGEFADLLQTPSVQSKIKRGLKKIIYDKKPDWLFYPKDNCNNCLQGNTLILKEEGRWTRELNDFYTTVVVGLYIVNSSGHVTSIGDYIYHEDSLLV